ncbi:MAG: hypothetical protein LBU06_10430 [Desulfovibrio sp.]|nr:hypothetical protein [Desulfovibrio sp.]
MTTTQISQNKIAIALKSRIENILSKYRWIIDLFLNSPSEKIPNPVAYELQHALAHLAHASTLLPQADKWAQYKKAIEHLERGLLDAWKLLIKDNLLHSKCLKDADLLSELITCRLREYDEVVKFNSASEGKCVENNHAVMHYEKLYSKLSKNSVIPKYATTNNNKRNKYPISKFNDFYKLFHEWAQCELILSALLWEKDMPTLEKMIAAVFNNFSIVDFEKCFGELYAKLCSEFMRIIDEKNDFKIWLDNPLTKKRHLKAFQAIESGNYENEDIKHFLYDDIFPRFKLKIRQYKQI